jgi:hypothetical protein
MYSDRKCGRKSPFGRQARLGCILLICTLKGCGGLVPSASVVCPLTGSCECGNEPSGQLLAFERELFVLSVTAGRMTASEFVVQM